MPTINTSFLFKEKNTVEGKSCESNTGKHQKPDLNGMLNKLLRSTVMGTGTSDVTVHKTNLFFDLIFEFVSIEPDLFLSILNGLCL
jgi:hypothetical protein